MWDALLVEASNLLVFLLHSLEIWDRTGRSSFCKGGEDPLGKDVIPIGNPHEIDKTPLEKPDPLSTGHEIV